MEDRYEKMGLFSISDFAEFARITKDTLIHYEKIGLLSPILRGDNHYRYYSGSQLSVVNVIRTFQELGMSLSDIKKLRDRRTPEYIDEIFEKQMEKINLKIADWLRAQKLLSALQGIIRSGLAADEQTVTVQFLQSEEIVLGDLNDYSKGQNTYDALCRFYRFMRETHPDINLNYPVWGFYSEEHIKRGNLTRPDRYYFYQQEGYDKRPAALYAIGYTRGGYGQIDELYGRIINYIDENGFEICGDAYEEYPLNEISVTDENNYLIRMMITVREKQQT